MTAAQTLRNEGEQGSILMLGAEAEYPYNRPPLTKAFLAGETTIEQMWLGEPDAYRNAGIDVRVGCRAQRICPDTRQVIDASGRRYHYGQLLLASGAHACRLDVPGAGLHGVFVYRTLAHARAVQQWIAKNPGPVGIVGTSFIAMELATTLTRMGLKVTLLDRADRVFPRIHSDLLSAYFLQRCENHGIDVLLNQNISRFHGRGKVAAIETTSGQSIECSTVVMAIGTAAQTDYLEASGIAVDDGVVVDEFLQTNQAGIFAAGDVANYPAADGQRQRSMHWQNARRQGQIAAKNMLGQRIPYASVLHYYCDFLDFSFTFLGRSDQAGQRITRGDLAERSFAELYLEDGVIVGLFSTGRPPEETQLLKRLIRDRMPVRGAERQLADPGAALDSLARETILILQGGAALGAFECGVIRAMDEAGIMPDVVGGVSIGAINGVIVAGNPGRAAEAVAAFWDEIGVLAPVPASDALGGAMAVGATILWGIPEFFKPRWLSPGVQGEWWPASWTSLYDPAPLRELLARHVDFAKLADSPIRLIVSAVEVDRGELVYFDSRVDTLTPDHILASCSLPPIFPWTTIDGRHYWDGGIISNSPLEQVLLRSGPDNKQVFIVDLFPGERPLPSNLAEVLSRRDEIIYGERIRNDAHVRELVHEFKDLVDEVMSAVEPDAAARLKQHPRYIQLMGAGGASTITRIVRDGSTKEPLAAHYDFSMQAIQRQRRAGYLTALRRLAAQGQAGG